jgi:hypothetical protein
MTAEEKEIFDAFTAKMWVQLERAERRGRTGWANCEISDLLRHADQEVEEVRMALMNADSVDDVLGECADAANMCLMVADVYRRKRSA